MPIKPSEIFRSLRLGGQEVADEIQTGIDDLDKNEPTTRELSIQSGLHRQTIIDTVEGLKKAELVYTQHLASRGILVGEDEPDIRELGAKFPALEPRRTTLSDARAFNSQFLKDASREELLNSVAIDLKTKELSIGANVLKLTEKQILILKATINSGGKVSEESLLSELNPGKRLTGKFRRTLSDLISGTAHVLAAGSSDRLVLTKIGKSTTLKFRGPNERQLNEPPRQNRIKEIGMKDGVVPPGKVEPIEPTREKTNTGKNILPEVGVEDLEARLANRLILQAARLKIELSADTKAECERLTNKYKSPAFGSEDRKTFLAETDSRLKGLLNDFETPEAIKIANQSPIFRHFSEFLKMDQPSPDMRSQFVDELFDMHAVKGGKQIISSRTVIITELDK